MMRRRNGNVSFLVRLGDDKKEEGREEGERRELALCAL